MPVGRNYSARFAYQFLGMKKPHACAWGFSATLGLLALALALGGLGRGGLGGLGRGGLGLGLWSFDHFDHWCWRRGEHLGESKLNGAKGDLAHGATISNGFASDEGFSGIINADVQDAGFSDWSGSGGGEDG